LSGFRAKRENDALLWTSPEHSVSIEAPWGILEEINGAVLEGFRRLSRGGIEVGGVLFGRRHDQIIRIHAWRPIPCEHSRGPAFLLSNTDNQGLVQMLETAESDPQLQVLEPVGWFVSHTRKGVAMTEDDADIFNRYFMESWQCTLVIHPEKVGASRAGFFLRDAKGQLRTDSSAKEFSIEGARATAATPSGSAVDPSPSQRSPRSSGNPRDWDTRNSSRGTSQPEHSGSAGAAAVATPAPVSTTPPVSSSPSSSPWRVLAVAAALLLFAIALFAVPKLRNPTSPAAAPSLHLVDADGQLRIEWDKDHPTVQSADGATVFIHDAGPNTPIELDQKATRSGSLTYLRLSEDVRVRLVLQRDGQPVSQELARYVGPPLPKAGARALSRARDNRQRYLLEAQNLREQLKKEMERTRQLEKAVRNLETQIQKEERAAARPPAKRR
jgi:hypothetical protein